MSQSINFDRAATYYDETRGFPPGVEQDAVRLFVQAGGLTMRSRVFEIGIGTGRIALPLAIHVGEYHGADISTGMLGRLLAKRGDEPILPVVADGTRLPYANATFDAIIAVHIFHLIADWRAALRECARILKPGAPLMHGWGARISEPVLTAAWDEAVREWQQDQVVPAPPIPNAESERFLNEAGWLLQGEQLQFTFTQYGSPQQFIDSLRERKWSHTWRMSDDVLERGIAAVEHAAREHFPDLNALIPRQQTFRVQAYLPPVS
jgi:SAM-dependent methyltransferase